MQKIKQLISDYQNYLTKSVAAASEEKLLALFSSLAFLIALWVVHLHQGALNSDSVLYFEAARLFSLGEWQEGMALFPLPLYSILIAALHNFTDLHFESVAQGLAAFFFAITTFSFITLIRLAGGNKPTMLCGALLLFSSSYIVGDVLPMLIRDQGFWAFLLTSLIFFIKFYRDGKLRDALLWQLFCILAMLFRVEAITFLALLPFVLFVNTSLTRRERLTSFIKAHVLNLFVAVMLVMVFATVPSLSSVDFGRLNELCTLLTVGLHNIAQQFTMKSALLGSQVLGRYLDGYGSIGLALTLSGIVLMKIANTAGWISIGLIALGVKNKNMGLKPDAQRIFMLVAILALINMLAILLRSYVLSSRYIIALGFILLIFSSFALSALLHSVKTSKTKRTRWDFKKWLLILVLAVLCLSFIKNVAPKRQNYAYEKEAVEWVKQNAPSGSQVFYVSPKARYYAGAPYTERGYDYWEFTSNSITGGTIQNYDYLVINMNNQYPEREKELIEALANHELVKEFVEPRGRKKIMVFARKLKR